MTYAGLNSNDPDFRTPDGPYKNNNNNKHYYNKMLCATYHNNHKPNKKKQQHTHTKHNNNDQNNHTPNRPNNFVIRIKLYDGKVECATCHIVHNLDVKFLLRSRADRLCDTCHIK